MGVYECQAENQLGSVVQKYFVYATQARKWTSKVNQTITSVQGHSIELIVCPLADLVFENLQILKDGVPLTMDDRRQLSSPGRLSISATNKDDSGVYSCSSSFDPTIAVDSLYKINLHILSKFN